MNFHADAWISRTPSTTLWLARTTGIEYARRIYTPTPCCTFLVEEIGLETIRDAVINPIRMDVAAYYGPEHATAKAQHAGDDAFMPTYLEQLIVALGGTPVDYDSKCQSVGAPALLTLNKPVMKMTAAAVMADAKSSGADLMVSACTMCHTRTLTPTNPRQHVKMSGKKTTHANRAPR